MDFHNTEVCRRCRICGKVRKPRSVSMSVAKYVDEFLVTFGTDVRSDIADVHPSKLCGSCYSFMKRMGQETTSGKPRETGIQPADWQPYTGETCELCSRWRSEKGGARVVRSSLGTKAVQKRGRPTAKTQVTWKGKPSLSYSSAVDELVPPVWISQTGTES